MNVEPIYDSIDGIKSFIKNLDSLNELRDLRHEAYYVRKESLHEYIVLGRYYLDRCGNFSIILNEPSYSIIPAEILSKCPEICTYDEMFKMLPEGSHITSTGYWLPPTYVKCSICDEQFTIKDCHNVSSYTNDSEHIDSKPFIGMQIGDLKQIPWLFKRKVHFITTELIGSDNYINTDGGNEKGWKYVKKDYIIKPNEKIAIQIKQFTHNDCKKINIIEKSLSRFNDLITSSIGFMISSFHITGIPNRYCPCDTCPPWYLLYIDDLKPIIIGWRKSVININWSKSGIDLLYLFENENVTKDQFMIHAHGYEKCSEYLNKIVKALQSNVT